MTVGGLLEVLETNADDEPAAPEPIARPSGNGTTPIDGKGPAPTLHVAYPR